MKSRYFGLTLLALVASVSYAQGPGHNPGKPGGGPGHNPGQPSGPGQPGQPGQPTGPTQPPSGPTGGPTQPSLGDLTMGEQVLALDSSKQVTIIGGQNGNYNVRDASGNVYNNVARSDLGVETGCTGSICVGTRFVAEDSSKTVTVIARRQDNNFAVQDASGNIYANVAASDLAVETGCANNVCVGQRMIAVDSNKTVTIIALRSDGSYVVQDASGNIYSDVARSDLGVESGCLGTLCVGAQVTAIDSNKLVTILAIETNNAFVVQDTSGNIYSNVAASDLSTQRPHPNPPGPPAPPTPPQPPRPNPPAPPAPQPPQPQPGQITCVIRSGENAYGQQTFNVLTTSGAIIGTFQTAEQASTFAEQDPRCRS